AKAKRAQRKRVARKPMPARKRRSRRAGTRGATGRPARSVRGTPPTRGAGVIRAQPVHAPRARAVAVVARESPAAATELSEKFVTSVAAVGLSNAADVDRYFRGRFRQPFLEWYRSAIDPKQPVGAAVSA